MEHATGPEVLGVGWPRTGTSSLKLALDGLGFGPCFHGRFIPYLPEVRQRCYAYATERDTVFPTREVFAAYRAAVDIPPGLIPHLLEAYPQAKVILTMRDADSWCTSMQNVIMRLYYWLLLPFFWTTRLGREYTAIIGWSLRCMFKGDLSRQSCIRAFHAHNESVRASVPAERLLLWRPQDGWEPLARFLDVPVPEAPFPQPQNEGSAEMLRQVGAFIWRYPLASVGLAQHSHQGPLTFEAIK